MMTAQRIVMETPAPADANDLDVAFLERLKRREPRALERFHELFFDDIYAYVRRLVPNEDDAEDVTRDVFLRVHAGLPRYDTARALSPWLFTIVANRVRDFWRARGVRDQRTLSLDDDVAAPAPAREEPAERLQDEERRERVRAAVYRLPLGMRTVLLLRVYDELSFDLIARILGLSPVAVRKRYSRAVQALRGLVGDDGEARVPAARVAIA
jgi:RNA polymerase sigma-70 factor (ECF subfamily)